MKSLPYWAPFNDINLTLELWIS